MLFSRAEPAALSDAQKEAILFGGAFGQLPPPCDAALVLGGGIDDMQDRAASAEALFGRVKIGKFIACGGAVGEFRGGKQAECCTLRTLLREAGVTAEIVEETSSKDTIENILFAFTLLKNDLLTQKRLRVVVVTSAWHLCRAVAPARCLMPKTVSVYGFHAAYDAERARMRTSPALRARAEGELGFLREAVACGFAEDFEI